METANFNENGFWLSEWDWYFLNANDKIGLSKFEKTESIQEYLRRGEIIESCAKKKPYRKYGVKGEIYKKIFTKKAFEKKGNQKYLYLRSRIAEYVIRPICYEIARRYLDTGVFEAKEFYELFGGLFDIKLNLEKTGYGPLIIQSLCRRHKKQIVCTVSVSISENDIAYAPLNDRLTEKQSEAEYYLKGYGEKSMCHVLDMGFYFVDYVILCMVLKYLKELPVQERKENRVWGMIDLFMESKIKTYMEDGTLYVTEEIAENEYFQRYIQQKNISYSVSKSENRKRLNEISELFLMNGRVSNHLHSCFICSRKLFLEMMEEYRKDQCTKRFLKELNCEGDAGIRFSQFFWLC